MSKYKSFIQYVDEDVYILCRLCNNGSFIQKSKILFKLDNSNKRKKHYNNNKINILKQQKKYRQTIAGKLSTAKTQAKRKRNLGYEPINEYFPGCVGHHIDRNMVVFIPVELHRSISHSVLQDRNMKEINTIAFEWIASQEVL